MKPNTLNTLKNKTKAKLFIILAILTTALIFCLSALCNQCAMLTKTAEQSQKQANISGSGQNHNPVINSISVSDNPVICNSTVDVWVDATDIDSDNLTYKWAISGGNATIDAIDSSHTTFKAQSSPTSVKIMVGVVDQRGGYAESAIDVAVASQGQSQGSLQSESSSQNNSQSQGNQSQNESGSQSSSGSESSTSQTQIITDSAIIAIDGNKYNGKSVSGTILKSPFGTAIMDLEYDFSDQWTRLADFEVGDRWLMPDGPTSCEKAYLSFNIEALKNLENLTITKVLLVINNIKTQNNPDNIANNLIIKQHNFDTLEDQDFSDTRGTGLASIRLSEIHSGYNLTLSSSNYPNLLATFQSVVNNITDSYHWYQIKLGLDNTKMGSYDRNDINRLGFDKDNITLTIEFQYTE